MGMLSVTPFPLSQEEMKFATPNEISPNKMSGSFDVSYTAGARNPTSDQ